jgi:hypothetical protein
VKNRPMPPIAFVSWCRWAKPSVRVTRPSGRWPVGPVDLAGEGAQRRLGAGRAHHILPHYHYGWLIQLVNLAAEMHFYLRQRRLPALAARAERA